MKQIKFFLDSECSTKRNTCSNKPEWVLYFTVQCELTERYIHTPQRYTVPMSRTGTLESPVSVDFQSNEKMEHADPELEPSLWRAGDHVRRPSSGIKIAVSNGLRNPPAVNMQSFISHILGNRQTAKNLEFLGGLT